MNEQGLQTETPADQDSECRLAEPHFDDIAIAIAQPVEPLTTTDRTRAHWQAPGILRHVSITALLLILAGAVGFASVTFALGVHRRFTAEEPQAAIIAPEQSTAADAVVGSGSNNEKSLLPRPAVRKVRPRVIQSRHVARMVGEVH